MLSAREDGENKAISIIYQSSPLSGPLERRSALCKRISPGIDYLLNYPRGRGRARSRNGTMAEEMARSKALWLDLRLPGAKQRVKSEMGVE